MRKDYLSTDTTFDPCWFSLDNTFKAGNLLDLADKTYIIDYTSQSKCENKSEIL
jgi:hypothetical protein